MNASDLIALAERVEQATAIEQRVLLQEARDLVFRAHPSRRAAMTALINAGAFLEAAMSLVPEGWQFSLRTLGVGGPPAWAEVYERIWNNGEKLKHREAFAATPALALVSASLRARAALMDTVGGDG